MENYTDVDNFMVTYGDGVADMDIRALVDFKYIYGRLATVTTVRPAPRFSILDLGDGGEVINFAEKPQLDGWASADFLVFNRCVFDPL